MRALRVLPFLLLLGCGSSSAPAPKAEEPKGAPSTSASPSEGEPADTKEPAAAEESKKVPDACDGDASACVMPAGFVRRLCVNVFPDLALMFFQRGTPWRRAYLAVKEATPFNAFNGPSSDQKLVFEEEMIVLREKKADTSGIQVSGAGASYDLLRWDGTCVTMSAEEVRLAAPPKPKHAPITWRLLEDATQEALRKNEALDKIVIERKKECKGATMGNVTAKCEKADRALNDRIAGAVRGGTTVPQPAKVP